MDEERLRRRYEREKKARLEAEAILERKSRELFQRNEELEKLSATLEKQVEERTRELALARDEALSAAKAKSEFMANMSHEIRTPLNGVIGMLHMLSDGQLESGQRELLQTAARSGHMLLEIVNDILDFSKIDAGQMELHEEVIHFRNLFDDTLAPMRHIAQERNLKLESQFDPDLPSHILIDGLRLRQILTNLLSNALKFTSEGGVEVLVEKQGQEFEILIRDTGLGMTDEQLQRIFSAFGQADGSITRQFGGTGLGLTITQSFVRMMGGQITVSSQPGEGSTFRVTLPLNEHTGVDSELPAQQVDEGVSFKDARILLVEDNEVNQQIALYLLNRANIEVDICNNGEESLLQVQLRPYDLVLMDIQMPVMDGLEATRQIRSFGAHYTDLPIIAMTAHATQAHRQESFEAGMNEHITKPIEPIELYRVLARYLEVASEEERQSQESLRAQQPDARPEESTQALQLPERIPGLNIAEALNRLGGNAKLYLRLITTFYNNQKNLLESVSDDLNAYEWESARIALHTAKGSSANISADTFCAAVTDFERALLDGQQTGFDSLLDRLAREWEVLEASVLQIIGQFVLEPKPRDAMSDEEAVKLLRQIDHWLHQDISRVEELIEEFSSRGYHGEYRASVDQLINQLEVFDVPAAERTLALVFENSSVIGMIDND